MASKKTGVHSGISPHDQEAIRRVSEPAMTDRSNVSPRAKQVPASQTKPGRKHDRSRGADAVNTEVDRETVEPGELGDTYESNTGGHVSHNNR